MLLDPSVIDKEDGYILEQIKKFASEIVNEVLPAQQLIVFVDRIVGLIFFSLCFSDGCIANPG